MNTRWVVIASILLGAKGQAIAACPDCSVRSVGESTVVTKSCNPPSSYFDGVDTSFRTSYYAITWPDGSSETVSLTLRGECGTHQPTCCWYSTQIYCDPERHQW